SIRLWRDVWIGDIQLSCLFPWLFALESNKDCLVVEKLHGSLDDSFRRPVRGSVEAHQFVLLQGLMETIVLSNVDDRWVWDLNGVGTFHVKDARFLIDDFFSA
nr:hypothetical protein [Tanacetum cinerariifolium]